MGLVLFGALNTRSDIFLQEMLCVHCMGAAGCAGIRSVNVGSPFTHCLHSAPLHSTLPSTVSPQHRVPIAPCPHSTP